MEPKPIAPLFMSFQMPLSSDEQALRPPVDVAPPQSPHLPEKQKVSPQNLLLCGATDEIDYIDSIDLDFSKLKRIMLSPSSICTSLLVALGYDRDVIRDCLAQLNFERFFDVYDHGYDDEVHEEITS